MWPKGNLSPAITIPFQVGKWCEESKIVTRGYVYHRHHIRTAKVSEIQYKTVGRIYVYILGVKGLIRVQPLQQYWKIFSWRKLWEKKWKPLTFNFYSCRVQGKIIQGRNMSLLDATLEVGKQVAMACCKLLLEQLFAMVGSLKPILASFTTTIFGLVRCNRRLLTTIWH